MTNPATAISGLVHLNESPSRPRLTREAAELMPLTSAALDEQHQFDAAQGLASQHGQELARTATGYRVSCQSTSRHRIDLQDASDFLSSEHKATSKYNP
jgi:hypothetical protein